jgi:hypothetical protein
MISTEEIRTFSGSGSVFNLYYKFDVDREMRNLGQIKKMKFIHLLGGNI